MDGQSPRRRRSYGHWRGDPRHPRATRDRPRYWQRGRYPSVYSSSHRYRYAWRPPVGYYFHLWNFGDYLPRGWYGPEYYIVDPWQFDLPLPPPGYDWVRVGDDAVLVDRFSGQVVQVVRDIFW